MQGSAVGSLQQHVSQQVAQKADSYSFESVGQILIHAYKRKKKEKNPWHPTPEMQLVILSDNRPATDSLKRRDSADLQ